MIYLIIHQFLLQHRTHVCTAVQLIDFISNPRLWLQICYLSTTSSDMDGGHVFPVSAYTAKINANFQLAYSVEKGSYWATDNKSFPSLLNDNINFLFLNSFYMLSLLYIPTAAWIFPSYICFVRFTAQVTGGMCESNTWRFALPNGDKGI